MRELQVPTRRIGVRLCMSQGRIVPGALFLHESRFHGGCAKEVLEELNDARAFLPFHAEDPSMGRVLVHKNHIVRVHLEDYEPALDEPHLDESAGAPCTLLLDDGCELQGRLLVAVPKEASRLLDRINSAERFMPLAYDAGLAFVHRDHVARVF
jgi:hypothetical protein